MISETSTVMTEPESQSRSCNYKYFTAVKRPPGQEAPRVSRVYIYSNIQNRELFFWLLESQKKEITVIMFYSS